MAGKRQKPTKAPPKPKSEKEKARKHVRVKPPKPDQKLTLKQSIFAKELMEGRSKKEAALIAKYSPLNPSQSAQQALKEIRKIAPEVMDEVGLSLKTIIQRHLVPLLHATEVKLAQNEGEYTDYVEVEALGTRTQATRMALELQNAFPAQQDPASQYGGIDTIIIDIPRPKWGETPVDIPAPPMPRLKAPESTNGSKSE